MLELCSDAYTAKKSICCRKISVIDSKLQEPHRLSATGKVVLGISWSGSTCCITFMCSQ